MCCVQDVKVEDWVTHSLGLPQYAEAFRSNAITVSRQHPDSSRACRGCITVQERSCLNSTQQGTTGAGMMPAGLRSPQQLGQDRSFCSSVYRGCERPHTLNMPLLCLGRPHSVLSGRAGPGPANVGG
jgi:hypothetical protein